MLIQHDPDSPIWTLVTPSATLDVRIGALGLECIYRGGPAGAVPGRAASGGGASGEAGPEPAEKIVDEVPRAMVETGRQRRPVIWRLKLWRMPEDDLVAFVLEATDRPLEAQVIIQFDAATGLFTQRTVLHHHGGTSHAAVEITGALSCWLMIQVPVQRILYLAGVWAEEAQLRGVGPEHTPLVLGSTVGKTGFAYQPYVALRAEAATYLCELFWSGNWSLEISSGAHGMTLRGGLNPWGFRHRLGPGEELALPACMFGRVEGELDAATRRLHDYRRARRPDPYRPIPVQFNTWYPYQGEPPERGLLDLLPLAARLGCEVFVVDAGWYRSVADNPSDVWWQRTGDWRVNRRLLPDGLRALSAACRARGLAFGIWFEPEAAGPAADIRRSHPEWLHHIDGQLPAPTERAVLNLGIPEARAYARGVMLRILAITEAAWLKWDFNTDLGAGGWAPGLPAALRARDPLVEHYRGLYRLQDEIRAAFPALVLEMCASGAGRMDGAILSHAHTNWMSDQPQALRQLSIHFGIQLAHPAVDCNGWLIDWPPGHLGGEAGQYAPQDDRGDLPFRLRVAMLGSFGISAPLDSWNAQDFSIAAEHVALYRSRLRALVQHADQHRLTPSPPLDGNGDWAAMWYAAKDGLSGALFAFRLNGAGAAMSFPLAGLQPDRQYRLHGLPDGDDDMAGTDLAEGLAVTLQDRYRSALVFVQALDREPEQPALPAPAGRAGLGEGGSPG